MADHLAPSLPLEEHRKLAAFAGEWIGEEWCMRRAGPRKELEPHASLRASISTDSTNSGHGQTRDGRETFSTHGVFTYDREDRLYKLFWHDSLGYHPPLPASGGWTGKTLILVRGSLRGNARHVYELSATTPTR